jgi:hypothetical protein
MQRLLKQEFPELGLRSWASWIFGPLYFQSKMQRLPIPHRDDVTVSAAETLVAEPLLVISSLHPAEEGHEPRSEGV